MSGSQGGGGGGQGGKTDRDGKISEERTFTEREIKGRGGRTVDTRSPEREREKLRGGWFWGILLIKWNGAVQVWRENSQDRLRTRLWSRIERGSKGA